MIEHKDEMDINNIEVSNVADWMRFNNPTTQKSDDSFDVEGEDILKLSGLGASFRRKVSRDLQKAFDGKDGSVSQQLQVQQSVSGYATFDLI